MTYFLKTNQPYIKNLFGMKSVTSLLLLLAAIQLFGQSENPDYDSELAKKLGADDYGMKMYVLVILKTGGNNTTDNDKRYG